MELSTRLNGFIGQICRGELATPSVAALAPTRPVACLIGLIAVKPCDSYAYANFSGAYV